MVLRGGNENLLDEVERCVHDALCVLKRTLENDYVLPGGGAVESEVSVALDKKKDKIASNEALAI